MTPMPFQINNYYFKASVVSIEKLFCEEHLVYLAKSYLKYKHILIVKI